MPAIIKIEINSASAGKGFEDAQRGLKDLDKAARDSGGGFSALKEIAIGALREIGAMATQALGAAASAAAGFVKDSVSAAGEFEAGINNLNSVAGSSLKETGFSLDDVREKALDMGQATQFSAQQSLDAMTELVKGGVDIKEVMGEATDSTLNLAAAGDGDLKQAATIVSKTLATWGHTGLTATQASDSIAAAANSSTLDVNEFAGAMYNAQGRAAAMNMDFDDFATTIAMISPGFKSGETAGVSYNNFLSSLIPKTKKADQAMYELGLITEDGTNKFFDSTGAFIGNREAARLLQGAFKDLNTEDALRYKNTIFGNDAMGTANMLIQEGVEGYDAAALAMDKAGTAADVAKTKQQGYAFAMEQFNGSMETLQIMIGTKLLPMLTPLVGKFTELVNIGLEFASGNYFTALTSLGSWLSENVNPALGSFVANLAIATDPLQTLKDGILTFLGDVAAQLPTQLMVWAEKFGAWVWDALPGMLSSLGSLATALLTYLGAQVPIITERLMLWAQKFGQWVLDALPGMGANLAALIQSLYTWLGTQVPIIVAQLAIWAQSFTDWVIAAAPVLLTELGTFLASMLAWLAEHAPEILAQLATWTAQFVSWAVETGVKLIVEMGTLFGKLLIWIKDKEPEITAQLQAWVKAFTEWVKDVWPKALQFFAALLNSLRAWIRETGDKLSADGSIGKALVDGIKKGIDGAVAGLISSAVSAVNRAIGAARAALPGGSGGGGTATGSFAMGGAVGGAPRMAWVGEHGPERVLLPAGAGVVPATASAAIANRTTNNNFNMTVNTNARASTVASDYGLMKALAGVR